MRSVLSIIEEYGDTGLLVLRELFRAKHNSTIEKIARYNYLDLSIVKEILLKLIEENIIDNDCKIAIQKDSSEYIELDNILNSIGQFAFIKNRAENFCCDVEGRIQWIDDATEMIATIKSKFS